MKNSTRAHYRTWTVAVAFLFLAVGCIPNAGQPLGEEQIYRKAVGYVYEIGEVKAGTSETAAYLPEKMRFELTNTLKGKGLLATASGSEKRLTVNLEVTGQCPGVSPSGDCNDCYTELITRLKVYHPQQEDPIAQAVIYAFNGGCGFVSISDFTEITHAQDIADFLEQVVR
ncbi:MAG: hypothetical protein DRH11_16955 [Deltaproteobacteria bacterium]|nr:MAG: hypothetical protein DRH11_16955 [Deltaproteobacteria bacterium]